MAKRSHRLLPVEATFVLPLPQTLYAALGQASRTFVLHVCLRPLLPLTDRRIDVQCRCCRTYVRTLSHAERGRDPARRPRRVLRVGRAARPSVASRPTRDRG